MRLLVLLLICGTGLPAFSQTQVDFRGVAEAKTSAVFNDNHFWVIGESSKNDSSFLAIASFDANGQLQSSFGKNGQLEIAISKGLAGVGIHCAAVDAKGRVLVGGYITRGNRWNWLMLCLLPDGNLDPSFGTKGIVEYDMSKEPFDKENVNRGSDMVTVIQVLGNGQLLVAGTINEKRSDGTALARLNEDGSFDETFGEKGVSRPGVMSGTTPWRIILLNNNEFYVGGDSWYPQSKSRSVQVARFDGSGNNLKSFNKYGHIETSITNYEDESYATFHDVVLLKDSSLLIAGSHDLKKGRSAIIGHYFKDGQKDVTYTNIKKPQSDQGAFKYYFAEKNALKEVLDLAPTVGGGFLFVMETYPNTIELIKLTESGTVMTSYGVEGRKSIKLESAGSEDKKFLIELNDGVIFFCSTNNFNFYLERVF